ncbi:hypothetical protein B2G71_06515 [Novosphingobium sp. PC22D]|uniref:hypothetical protein n=1 Tax=Novosphingobium sp. PC22D TaxID=1962403 RepID=UPI000BEF57D4|nr:hypothetical protein [Novosphingobium sp. PC22D]PEQ14050.1 hypothetical protein B2G71_06515 [Novosphingobium sp. PC22D]
MTLRRLRGRPLLALIVILGSWIVVRDLTWTAPVYLRDVGLGSPQIAVEPGPGAPGLAFGGAPGLPDASPRPADRASGAATASVAADARWPAAAAPWPRRSDLVAFMDTPDRPGADAAARQELVLMEAFGQAEAMYPLPSFRDAPKPKGRSPRWSADGWLLLRRDGRAELASGLLPASYGASQAGAVLRYSLDEASGHRPKAYVRGTTTLRGPDEVQAAIGLSTRPVPGVPMVLAAEVRATEGDAGSRVQPAAFAVSELAPIALPLALRAEIYAQAGFVGGEFATLFADGQLRVDREVARWRDATARIGAGGWAGAQKGAARFDLGPSAMLAFPLADAATARVAVDWRMRVAGDAEPRSGPALTLSAGF